jgi:hypothetical protein
MLQKKLKKHVTIEVSAVTQQSKFRPISGKGTISSSQQAHDGKARQITQVG